MIWATYGAIFSQTHLVTLLQIRRSEVSNYLNNPSVALGELGL
jgi:hypothetical protein